MATLNDTDGFILHGWMVNELHLEGADLFTFALVHQFSQSGAGLYKGNTKYLAAWTGWSENTCRTHLVRLAKKGLIEEVRGRENNSPFCYYKLPADFYEKHPSIFAVSPLKNCADHTSKNGESTPQNLRIDNNSRKVNKENNTSPIPSEFIPPTREEIIAYCEKSGYRIDADKFLDYYEKRGWVKKNGQPVKDWKGTVRTWWKEDHPQSKPMPKPEPVGPAIPINPSRPSLEELMSRYI